jgi:hypothetical protein
MGIHKPPAQGQSCDENGNVNKKFWEDLIACFPFTTYCVFDTTRIAQKTPNPTGLLLWRVYSLP